MSVLLRVHKGFGSNILDVSGNGPPIYSISDQRMRPSGNYNIVLTIPRSHVFKDLRPYVCTFQNCHKTNHLFASRHEWYDHEETFHRREWYCKACDTVSSSQSDFESHLRENHSDLQLELEQCERPIQGKQECPLCCCSFTRIRFRRHLARHMQRLALYGLRSHQYDIASKSSSECTSDPWDGSRAELNSNSLHSSEGNVLESHQDDTDSISSSKKNRDPEPDSNPLRLSEDGQLREDYTEARIRDLDVSIAPLLGSFHVTWLGKEMDRWVNEGWITQEHKRFLNIGVGFCQLQSFLVTADTPRAPDNSTDEEPCYPVPAFPKLGKKNKNSKRAILDAFIVPRGAGAPTLVVECGALPDEKDMISDMRTWFRKGRGLVNKVILMVWIMLPGGIMGGRIEVYEFDTANNKENLVQEWVSIFGVLLRVTGCSRFGLESCWLIDGLPPSPGLRARERGLQRPVGPCNARRAVRHQGQPPS